MEENAKQAAFQMYLMRFTFMTKDTFVSFSEFYESMKPQPMDTRSTDEIMSEIQSQL